MSKLHRKWKQKLQNQKEIKWGKDFRKFDTHRMQWRRKRQKAAGKLMWIERRMGGISKWQILLTAARDRRMQRAMIAHNHVRWKMWQQTFFKLLGSLNFLIKWKPTSINGKLLTFCNEIKHRMPLPMAILNLRKQN